MGLNLPLAVRLKTASGDKHVTRDLRDLTYRSTAPGGFASATISLDRPLDVQPFEIDYYGSLYVYDKRNGEVAWEGRVEDPGRTAADGEIWQLTATGGGAHAQDRTVPLIYVDQSISDGWIMADRTKSSIAWSVSADPSTGDDSQVIMCQIPQGLTVVTNDHARYRYARIADAGQKLARIDYAWSATNTATLSIDGIARNAASGTTFRTQLFSTGPGAAAPAKVVTDWPLGKDTFDLRAIYGGAGGTFANENWVAVRGVFILAVRFDQAGNELGTAATYTANSVLASDVVADLLGRLLNKFDGANASIAATAFAIDSLAYPEGITPAQLLDDLMLLEPGFFWAAWESNSAGLYRFEWSPWPTTVRYEATVYDGFDSPGSAVDLYNAVQVRYIATNGKLKTTRRTQTVTALTNAGLTREGLLDLTVSQGRHSLTMAQRAGDQWLAQRAVPPNAGTLTVARPIRDLITNTTVMPWEIRPGNLIRVKGVLPRVDALNPTARDGVTIFRIPAAEFQASSATARLELDSYPRTVARALALLGKHR